MLNGTALTCCGANFSYCQTVNSDSEFLSYKDLRNS
jgi:hypothetical protein